MSARKTHTLELLDNFLLKLTDEESTPPEITDHFLRLQDVRAPHDPPLLLFSILFSKSHTHKRKHTQNKHAPARSHATASSALE